MKRSSVFTLLLITVSFVAVSQIVRKIKSLQRNRTEQVAERFAGEQKATSVPGNVAIHDALQATALSPRDFSASAERVTFDSLSAGSPVTFQLTMQGVGFRSRDGAQVLVVDAKAMDGDRPQSAPYAVTTASKNAADAPMEILFNYPKKKVGMYFGHVKVATRGVLTAYDEADRLIGKVSVKAPAGSARDVRTFIGLGLPEATIHRVTLEYAGTSSPKTIDDLMVEPRQNETPVQPFKTALLAPEGTRQSKLEAISSLQLHPSKETSLALREAAKNDRDFSVRESAIMALIQIRDPEAIPALVEIGINAPNEAVRLAAYNAVWDLRQIFPMTDPPSLKARVVDQIKAGGEFTVEAEIVSPVNRDNARIRFGEGGILRRVKTADPPVYKGRLEAGKPVILRTRFLALNTGTIALPLTVRISLNSVDATTYKLPLYIQAKEGGGSFSLTPFPPGPETPGVVGQPK